MMNFIAADIASRQFLPPFDIVGDEVATSVMLWAWKPKTTKRAFASPELLRHDWQETGLQFLCIDGSYVAFWMKFFVLENSLRNVPMRLCI
jgi:hypothetical protein